MSRGSYGQMSETIEDEIAQRVARDLKEGWYVNLGVGIPIRAPKFVPSNMEVMFHSENGIIGLGPAPPPGQEDDDLVNAGKQYATVKPGGCFFDSSLSFAIVRGKHLDVAVVGAYQVSQAGDIANWSIPGQRVGGIGGALDLAVGAKTLWVTMTHTTRDGKPKLVDRCTYPLTALNAVSRVYTDMAVIDVTREGFVLRETVGNFTFEDVAKKTGAPLKVANESLSKPRV